MKKVLSTVLAFAALGIFADMAHAGYLAANADGSGASSIMRVYGLSRAPVGYVKFCAINPAECKRSDQTRRRLHLTPSRWRDLEEVNHIVNRTVEPVTDKELYGEVERWSFPKRYGDCEDYVLLKRKLLAERGWPMSALLITVVRDERGDGHAVLTVRTAEGDFLLDNKREDVLVWHQLPYSFVKRQSYLNPSYWVSLEPKRTSDRLDQTGME